MYEAIFPNLQNIPWGLIILAFAAGVFVAQKFRDKVPDLFAPKPASLTAEDVARIVAETIAKTK